MLFNNKIKSAKDIDGVRRSAFWHLGRRDHSEKELRDKIARKTDNQQWIDAVIRECIENNYLNDGRFTENFIRSAQYKGFGITRIKYALQRKGIVSSELLNTLTDNQYDYLSSAVTLLSAKYNKHLSNQSVKQKAMVFLQGKGHVMDDIFKAIERHNHNYPVDENNILHDTVALLTHKFKAQICDRKTRDKATRFLISKGYHFSDTQDAIRAYNAQITKID